MSNLEAIAEQIGEAVMDAIEQKRRINKADLVDAAHNVLRRRHALLGLDAAAPGMAAIMDSVREAVRSHENLFPPSRVSREMNQTHLVEKLARQRLIVRSPDGSVRRVTEEEAAVLYGACCQRDTP